MKILEIIEPMDFSDKEQIVDILKSDGEVVNKVNALYYEIKSDSTLNGISYVKTPLSVYKSDLPYMKFLVSNLLNFLSSNGFTSEHQSVKLLNESMNYLKASG
jgi:hypothetical protein